MKAKLYFRVAALACMTAAIAACSENEEARKQTNYVYLSSQESLFLTEDQSDTLVVDLLLSQAVQNRTVLDFELQQNTDSVLALLNSPLVLEPGSKTAALKIVSNKKGLLEETRSMRLTLKSSTDAQIKLWNANPPLIIQVRPDSELQELTDAQKQLLAGYRERLGIDVSRFLGRLDCKVRIVFPTDERGSFFTDNEVREFQGKSVLALSDQATPDSPVLKMTDNPMGLTSFLDEIFKKETVDNEFWMGKPYAQPVLNLIGYQPAQETFNVTLDSLVLKGDHTVDFLAERKNNYDEPITVVPFRFSYSAWERMKKQAERGDKFQVEEGGTKVEYTLADAIATGTSLNPDACLFSSSLEHDAWENEPSDWVKPSAVFDEQAGTLTFTFPWDHSSSSGYTQIQVVYTLKNKK